ncbi:glycosyl hydrolase family 61-domain-containing protein [Trametes punicea]|nr:glycosyl hydrolase family 61-domain-containing protein [Trametes punicea]
MRSSLSLLPALLAMVPYASAHGWVTNVTVDGKVYEGNAPGGATNSDPIRAISTTNPILSTTDPSLSCGQNAQLAQEVADATAGSNITFWWVSGSAAYEENWVHNVGPIMTYMAMCEDTTCDQFDASKAKWFKTDQAGMVAGTQGGMPVWVQGNIHAGQPYTTQIPNNLKPGQYLIRNEIIALQNAKTPGEAEFYPSCTQLNISGDGDGTPNATVSFPGAYHADDPGILVDVYTPPVNYVFPGPPVAAIVADESTGNDVIESSSPSSISPQSSAAPFGSSGSAESEQVASSVADPYSCRGTQPPDAQAGNVEGLTSSAVISATPNDVSGTSEDSADSSTMSAASSAASSGSSSPSCRGIAGKKHRRFWRRMYHHT